jgi:hypothetical protein
MVIKIARNRKSHLSDGESADIAVVVSGIGQDAATVVTSGIAKEPKALN